MKSKLKIKPLPNCPLSPTNFHYWRGDLVHPSLFICLYCNKQKIFPTLFEEILLQGGTGDGTAHSNQIGYFRSPETDGGY